MKLRTLISSAICAVCLMTLVTAADAQNRLPDDPETIIGKLDNGMTYYLRHNSNPKGCADFYIAHNVGALQEEDNQNGLAHFLEHMAFNGTRHYPGKSLFDFLAKEGVRFGYNINAYTSRTETVYNLSEIPLVRESFVDSVMMVLHDWSCDILCEQTALDEERGVISEEWRRRDEQRARMAAAQHALVYKGSKHPTRSVIGTLEIINGFKRDEILDFYHKWYRPDLQAIIIVGDFDPKDMESRVKRIFSDIPAAENPTAKEDYPVPALTEPLFENMTDPDIRFQTLKVIHRLPYPGPHERGTEEFWKQHYLKQVVTSVLEKRLRKAAQQKDSPVSSAVVVTNPSGADYYTTVFTLSAKSDKLLEKTLEFYCREYLRTLRHGFTQEEFNVAKFHTTRKNKLDTEKYASEVTNEELVNIYKEHFLRNRPTTFPTELHSIQKNVMSSITYEEALKCLQEMLADSEKIYSYTIGVKKQDKLPSKETMQEIIARVEKEDIEDSPVTFKKIDLECDAPQGSITGTKKDKMSGEVWTLSNGAVVHWIPSEKVKSDVNIAMEVRFDTGYRTWPQDNIGAGRAATSYISRNAGFSNATFNDISSSPDCGGVRMNFEFDKSYCSIKMSSNDDNAVNGFKMLNRYLCNPYFDSEANLKRFKANNLRMLRNASGNQREFDRGRNAARLGDHPWIAYTDSSDINSVDMAFVEDIYSRCFNSPEDMTVFICSDMDAETVRDLVEKYVASWTVDKTYDKVEDMPFVPSYEGETIYKKTYPMTSAPKADVQYGFLAETKHSAKNEVAYAVLDYIMSQRCVAKIREERGGTYHVRFATEELFCDGLRESSILFQTRPEMLDILVQDSQDLIDDICEKGPTAEEMDNAVKYLIKADGEKEQRMANWLTGKLNRHRDYVLYGIPYGYDYAKTIGKLKAKDIKKLAKEVNNGNRFISIYIEQ